MTMETKRLASPVFDKYIDFRCGSKEIKEGYYSDDLFYESSYRYNPSLATASLSLAMSAFSYSGMDLDSRHDDNVNHFMREMGFQDRMSNPSFNREPEVDSIGYFLGNKKIIDKTGEEKTLIAVAIRGGGYGKEWGSNITMGKEGYHTGFSLASDKVINGICSYILNVEIKGSIKLWITGYSRAAATANLVAGKIIKRVKTIEDSWAIINSGNLAFDDLYTYTFATPAGATELSGNDVYKNIFNILNPMDLIPFVAPKSMGFERFGVDIYLPSAENSEFFDEIFESMLCHYQKITGKEFRLPDFIDDTDSGLKEDDLIDIILEFLENLDREFYAEKMEEEAQELMESGADFDDWVRFFVRKKASIFIRPSKYLEMFRLIKENMDILLKSHEPELCLAWVRTFDPKYGGNPKNYTVY